MREWNGPKNSQARVLTERDTPRAAIALLVKSKHDGAAGRRCVESAGSMAEVMFEIEDAEIRRPTERVQQAPIVEFAAQLAKRLGFVEFVIVDNC